MATGCIANARHPERDPESHRATAARLDSRIVIEQARGILAERHGTDAATAFDRLRAKARSSHRKIHDVARAVVDGSLTPRSPAGTRQHGSPITSARLFLCERLSRQLACEINERALLSVQAWSIPRRERAERIAAWLAG